MPIVRITGQGLGAIALSVALLWACLVGERIVVRRAVAERSQLMREIQQMQRSRHSQPPQRVSTPAPIPHPARITVG
jgi:hypothetical protein